MEEQPICEIDFASFLPKGGDGGAAASNQESVQFETTRKQAEALLVWWKTFQQAGFLKKNPAAKILEDSRERGILRLGGIENEDDVQKKMKSSLKKIQVQDLGNMRAQDLLASIPEEDPQGRGRKDLRDMERKLSVKIVFGPGQGETHVYLVGDAKKLEKKVFCIRNLLSHYHWRLVGTDKRSSKK